MATAMQLIGAELQRLGASEVRTPNLDVNHAAELLRAAALQIRPLLPELSRLPDFDPTILEKLPAYATIMADAHRRSAPDLHPRAAQAQTAKRARHFVVLFRTDLEVLVGRGLVAARAFQMPSATGYKHLARELMTMTGLLRAAWPTIHDKCAVTSDELLEAEQLIQPLCEAAVPMPSPEEEARQLRDRAFTAALRDYDEVRAALAYVRRRYGDADELAPPLYGKNRAKRRPSLPSPSAPAGSASAPEPSRAGPF